MNKFNNQAIAEAAYYIWKNNGCPSNTHTQDWNLAISQLSALSAKASSKKLSSVAAKTTKSTTLNKTKTAKKSK